MQKSMHEMGRTLHELGVGIKFAGLKMHFLTSELVILQGYKIPKQDYMCY